MSSLVELANMFLSIAFLQLENSKQNTTRSLPSGCIERNEFFNTEWEELINSYEVCIGPIGVP